MKGRLEKVMQTNYWVTNSDFSGDNIHDAVESEHDSGLEDGEEESTKNACEASCGESDSELTPLSEYEARILIRGSDSFNDLFQCSADPEDDFEYPDPFPKNCDLHLLPRLAKTVFVNNHYVQRLAELQRLEAGCLRNENRHLMTRNLSEKRDGRVSPRPKRSGSAKIHSMKTMQICTDYEAAYNGNTDCLRINIKRPASRKHLQTRSTEMLEHSSRTYHHAQPHVEQKDLYPVRINNKNHIRKNILSVKGKTLSNSDMNGLNVPASSKSSIDGEHCLEKNNSSESNQKVKRNYSIHSHVSRLSNVNRNKLASLQNSHSLRRKSSIDMSVQISTNSDSQQMRAPIMSTRETKLIPVPRTVLSPFQTPTTDFNGLLGLESLSTTLAPLDKYGEGLTHRQYLHIVSSSPVACANIEEGKKKDANFRRQFSTHRGRTLNKQSSKFAPLSPSTTKSKKHPSEAYHISDSKKLLTCASVYSKMQEPNY